MNLIPDSIDLSSYMDTPNFSAKVRSAVDFKNAVKQSLKPKDPSIRGASMLLEKANNTIEFRPGEVTAWVGYNGHRKSMFTSQVALDLSVQGERSLIVSLEMQPADTMARMTRQAVGLPHPSDRDVDTFHDWADKKLWLFDHVGTISVEHAFALCRYFRDELKGTQVFLDSMMMICTSEEKLDEQKKFSTGCVRLAQETGLHIHVITHCRKPPAGGEEKVPTRYEIRGSGAISDQAHNVMAVWMNKAKYAKLESYPNDMEALDQPCAVVKCDKQRNGKWEGAMKLWHDERSLRFCDDRISPVKPYPMMTTKENF